MKVSVGSVSDRTLNRAIVGLLIALAIAIPAVAAMYYFDRHVDSGPGIAERTIAAAEAAVRADPNKLSARLALASAYAADGRQSDAIAQYDQVLGADATNRAALIGRADAHMALNELDAAATDYQAFVDVASGEDAANVDLQLESAYFGLGSIALQQDRPRDAATFLADALAINRTDADALNLMGTALIQIGDFTNAVSALRDAVALVPTGWCDPYVQLGQAYSALDDAAGITYASGMTAFCEGRSDEAVEQLTSLAGGPYAEDALIGRGLIAESLGQSDTAAGLYLQVYDQDPTNFQAVNGLNRLGAVVPTLAPSAEPSGATGEQ